MPEQFELFSSGFESKKKPTRKQKARDSKFSETLNKLRNATKNSGAKSKAEPSADNPKTAPKKKRAPKKVKAKKTTTEPNKIMSAEELLEGLTPPQKEAVLHKEGPMLVVAGAGSGKTRVITRRVAHLIHTGVSPRSILSITFTNKAAGEMKERVNEIVGGKGLWVSTFHAFCTRFLREDVERLNALGGDAKYSREFSIYAGDDSEETVRDALRELNAPDTLKPRAAQTMISRWKSDLVSPAAAREKMKKAKPIKRIVADAYVIYERFLRSRGALDFDDLLLKTLEILRLDKEAREKWQNRFKFLQVDEYQDTNRIQYEIVSLLAGTNGNVTIVGDPDQSIYSWRGADPTNIDNFLEDRPSARVVKLNSNFRSKQAILNAAGSLIAKNSGIRAGVLQGARGEGSKPLMLTLRSDGDESTEVARRCDEAIKAGRRAGDIAVFYRTNAQSRSFEQAMMERGIPYVLVGATSFYQRKEVKDAISYLRVSQNRNDEVGLKRIVNTPRRGIGAKAMMRLTDFARANDLTLGEAIVHPQLAEAVTEKIAKSLLRLDRLLTRLASLKDSPSKAVRAATEETGLRQMYNKIKEDDRVDNLDELANAAAGFEVENEGATLADFLERTALIADVDSLSEETERVALMTLHAAKGLEFGLVFVVGVEDGILPHGRSIGDEDPSSMEEERRLLYVGMTRAMDELVMCCVRERFIRGQTNMAIRSRFINELDSKSIEFVNLDGGGGSGFNSEYSNSQNYGQYNNTNRPRERYKPAPTFIDETTEQIERQIHEELSKEDAGTDAKGAPLLKVKVGMRVKHPIFGTGKVKSVAGTGPGTRVTIDFYYDRTRTLALGFAKLRKA